MVVQKFIFDIPTRKIETQTGSGHRVGEKIGQVYSTDIMAYVNGHPIPSYNIGGRTCISIEDLGNFGFTIGYYDTVRTLTAFMFFDNHAYKFDDLKRDTPGKITGNVFWTDITAYISGIMLDKTYNIGGRTCVCIEDLGNLADSPYAREGYSQYSMWYRWDAAERTISLYTANHLNGA